jgi:hypothetical protein
VRLRCITRPARETSDGEPEGAGGGEEHDRLSAREAAYVVEDGRGAVVEAVGESGQLLAALSGEVPERTGALVSALGQGAQLIGDGAQTSGGLLAAGPGLFIEVLTTLLDQLASVLFGVARDGLGLSTDLGGDVPGAVGRPAGDLLGLVGLDTGTGLSTSRGRSVQARLLTRHGILPFVAMRRVVAVRYPRGSSLNVTHSGHF